MGLEKFLSILKITKTYFYIFFRNVTFLTFMFKFTIHFELFGIQFIFKYLYCWENVFTQYFCRNQVQNNVDTAGGFFFKSFIISSWLFLLFFYPIILLQKRFMVEKFNFWINQECHFT